MTKKTQQKLTGDAEKCDRAVQAMVAGGTSRQKACLAVGRSHPDWHEAWLVALNPNSPLARAAQNTGPDGAPVIRVFNQMVSDEMAKGLTKLDAVKAVANREPELHRAFLKATNPNSAVLL